MRVIFIKETKDARENSKAVFPKGDIRKVSDDLGKMYIDKGYAKDYANKYIVNKKIEENGE